MGIQEAELKYSSEAEINAVVDKLKATFESGRTRPVAYRKKQLRGMLKMLNENKEVFKEALKSDLRKSSFESDVYEIAVTISETVDMIDHVDEWSKHEVLSNDITNIADKTIIRNDPKGTVLIIGAWNYPVNLTLCPMVGAIAAGCTAVLKPSEVSSHTAKLLGELFPKYLDPEAFAVIQGAVDETTQLLKHQWDHIFYTGNGAVGKVIMAAAAKHLTPVTLELGGKSPAIVSDDSDIDILANRLMAGRLVNTGQTCVCIDYVLCTEATKEKLLPKLKGVLREWYGEDIQSSADYGRIVNGRHWNRIMGYLKATKGKIVLGGESDEKDLYIAPTVVVDADDSEPLLTEEIFGPILPIRVVKDLDEAVKYVNARPPPLALYVFTRNDKDIKFVLDRTRSGGVCVNDSLIHLACSNLPFGGVGSSGMGGYHNKFSFDTFTHKRATLVKQQNMEFLYKALRYPKFSDQKANLLSMVMFKSSPSNLPKLPWKNIFIVVLLGVIVAQTKPDTWTYLFSRFFKKN